MSDEQIKPSRLFTAGLVRYRTPLVVTAHALLFTAALFAAFALAYNFHWAIERDGLSRGWFTALFLPLLAISLPIKLLVFFWAGQYRGSWRYIGLRDLFSVISVSLIGTFVFLSAYFGLENLWQILYRQPLIDESPLPLLRQSSVFFLDWTCTVGLVCAARILVRFYHEDIQSPRSADASRVLIVGAGDAGESLVRELLRTGRERYECVGFVDDQARPQSMIHGVEVLGRTSEIREICVAFEVREVLIARPKATPRTIRDLVERCEGTGVLFRTIPAVADLMEGRVQVSQIRNVDIEDLLGREPVKLDTDQIGAQLRDQCVVVTGAGGSIGSEICRQVAAFAPRRMILIERSENSLFEIDRELRQRFDQLDVVPRLADVVDRATMVSIFAEHKSSVIFHAAAHKHVPMMELNPPEAVKNNVGGSTSVAEAAIEAGVRTMVMVSTDKAVNPTSVMGCTKRIAEMYVQTLPKTAVTSFITVRFGNVLGSSGSVVPIFKEQIARGGPVTVTHRDMIRYFMTIPEAAQLVLQAGTMGNGGEIYVLQMGDPVKILDLARDMITLSGLKPHDDIEIVFSGVRPGEKLYEELSGIGEDIATTEHPKIGIWKHREQDHSIIKRAVERLLETAESNDTPKTLSYLHEVVPEYHAGGLNAVQPHPAAQTVEP